MGFSFSELGDDLLSSPTSPEEGGGTAPQAEVGCV
jgi:hypothetical protein